jgi:thiol-disulfide isomerase/thioredoxin
MRGSVRLGVGALVLALTAGVAGCTPAPAGAAGVASGGATASANPNTPALIAQRVAAGLPDCEVPAGGAAPLQEGLPDLVLPCLGSERAVNLAQLRGRPLVVNLWAQWCAPCKAEAPVLAEFARRAGDQVAVVGINYADPDPAAAIAFAGSAGWAYPHLVDAGALLRARLSLPGIPVTLLVAADGRVVYRVTGGIDSVERLTALARDRLGVTA